MNRIKLGVLHEVAADLFALTIFLCDELLQLKPDASSISNSVATNGAFRFFSIVSKLPMELQMLLCHRVVGSTKQNVLHQDSEDAFKFLARMFLPPTPMAPQSVTSPPPNPTTKIVDTVASGGKQCLIC